MTARVASTGSQSEHDKPSLANEDRRRGSAAPQRLPFVDWTRGFAVVAMVLWHTADAWLLPSAKHGEGFAFLRFLGGLAAPGFLLLAGCAAALAAHAPTTPEARARALRSQLARALQIVLFGYLLRLQAWTIDAGAIGRLEDLCAWLPLGLGYASLLLATVRWRGGRPAVAFAAAGLALCASGLVQVAAVHPARFLRLMQVDVLQAIGVSLGLLSLGQWAFGWLARPGWMLVAAAAAALVTGPLWGVLPGPLPHAIAGYLGRYPAPPGVPPLGLFPLFPWFSYTCLGAALGGRLRDAAAGPDPARLERTVITATVLGALLAINASEAHPHIRALLVHQEWTAQPLRVVFRAGIVMTLLGLGWTWATGSRGRVLTTYGRASLRIYWAHMLFAYGILGRLWHKQLHYGAWLALAMLLLVLMWLFSQAKLGRASGRPHPRLNMRLEHKPR